MKLRLRRHETRETLKLELADTATLHDLRRHVNESAPSSVHLSLNRKDELLASSPEDTLRSLGVTSGDLIYYSLDQSVFVSSVQEIGLASSSEAHQALIPSGESSDGKLAEFAQSESIQASIRDYSEVNVLPDVKMNTEDQAKANLNSGVEDPAEGSTVGNSGVEENPEPMDIEELDMELAAAGSKRLSEPFFLKKILLEKSGDTSDLTTLALSVHAVMLESGFLLFNSGSDKFSFSKELPAVSLKYTLSELITSKDTTSTIASVTLTFQRLGPILVVYGTLGGSGARVHKVYLDKSKILPIIDLVMDTLESDKEGSSSIYSEVFMFWRMVKDGLVTPLLIGLCDKVGLKPPPCLMLLPAELQMKILEFLPGVSLAKMACLCTEMRYLASNKDLWKQKCLEENKNLVVTEAVDSVNWKAKYAAFWRKNQRFFSILRRNFSMRRRFPRISGDPTFKWCDEDHLHGSIRIPGQLARGLGGRSWGQSFTPRCNHR